MTRWSQGAINIVVNAEKEGFAHSFNITHGTGVCAIGLKVEDAAATLDRAERLLDSRSARRSALANSKSRRCAALAAASSISSTPRANSAGCGTSSSPRPGEAAATTSAGLTVVDHISQSMHYEEMLTWVLFYTSLLDLKKTAEQDVLDPGRPRQKPGGAVGRRRAAHRAQCVPIGPHAILTLSRRDIRLGRPAHRVCNR